MIELNAHTDDDILAIKVSGKLSKADLDDLKPALNKFTTVTDDPHLIMILEDFGGWADTAAFWKDLQLDAEFIGYFDRIAVVGDKQWQEWGTKLVNPITKEELMFFPIDQSKEAWNWVRSDH
ncbi:STAS/SEC14 domain-containing protein [Fodinibius sp. SL11]|uniref:STAS/SEC14 domain-containing protein n=1 Tax=Fodinibius sp. SL11 TaxID=3425690 RepID=UPI003F88501D